MTRKVMCDVCQVHHNLWQGNPNGCWDWWGYLGDSEGYMYATQQVRLKIYLCEPNKYLSEPKKYLIVVVITMMLQGRQMAGVARMVERLAHIQMTRIK